MMRAHFLVLASMLLACRPSQGAGPTQGRLEVSWTGKDRGGISGPAQARWCAARRVLEIEGIKGDTGIALALYPERSLVAGTYRVVDPVRAESLPPAAGVAVRWLGQTIVQGFQGDSGRVLLQRSGSGLLSGRIDARARSVVDTQRIRLSGTFQDLVSRSDTQGCGTQSDQAKADPDPQDTSVH